MPRSSTTLTRNTDKIMMSPSPAALRRRNKDGFTPSQARIMHYLAEGMGNTEIQDRLCIVDATLYSHLVFIKAVLGLHTTRQLVSWAARHGYGIDKLQQVEKDTRHKFLQRRAVG